MALGLTGTWFRLDHRGETAGAAPSSVNEALSRRGRVGPGRRGRLDLAVGGDDHWPQARQRLDCYHAIQHLVAVGQALFGKDKARLKAWLKPLVKQPSCGCKRSAGVLFPRSRGVGTKVFGRRFGSASHMQFFVNMHEMSADGGEADVEFGTNFLV